LSYDLVIADMHDHPEDNFLRQEALGKMILAEKPRTIIMLGDGSRHDAFSTYDKYKQWTAKEEIAAWHHSLSLIFGPLQDWNRRQRSHRHKQHEPRTVFTMGNHEERMFRELMENPHGFGSLIDFDEITSKGKHFDEVYEYGDVVNVNGIDYTHAARNKMNRPMALSTLAKQSRNHTIVGHTHTMEVRSTPLLGPENGVRTTLVAPAFMDMQNKEPYCRNATTGWVYGFLKVRPSGSPTVPFGYEYVSTDRLLEEWL
jgi:predicted phosphodiesterase